MEADIFFRHPAILLSCLRHAVIPAPLVIPAQAGIYVFVQLRFVIQDARYTTSGDMFCVVVVGANN